MQNELPTGASVMDAHDCGGCPYWVPVSIVLNNDRGWCRMLRIDGEKQSVRICERES